MGPSLGDPEGPVGTAVTLSRSAFADGEVANALLVREEPSMDALASGGLQGLFRAPLLLTGSDALSPATAAEIDRLGKPSIHILGGEDVIPAHVEERLKASGHMTHRHSGPTAAATAVSIAQLHFAAAESAILVAYDASADPRVAAAEMAAVGGLAAARQSPVLLTARDELDPVTRDYLRRSSIRNVLIIGGDTVVAPDVERALRRLGVSSRRIAGADRFDTAVAVASERGYRRAADADAVLLVDGSGGGWPSGLVAAVHATRTSAAVVLSDGDGLPVASSSYLVTASTSTRLICMPGVSVAACTEANRLLEEN